MRNLLRFILQYYFSILFVLLEVVAVVLIINHNPIQRGHLTKSFNSLSSMVYQSAYRLTGYLHLKEANDQLSRENARLRSLAISLPADSIRRDSLFEFVPANVINNSVNKSNNYLTLDVGSVDGIKADMGVIGPGGVVGVIKAVSKNYCRVLSVLNNELLVSVKLKDHEFFGSMVWDRANYRDISVTEIPSHATAQAGDTLVTSGFSSIFPPEIPVAVVQSSELTRDGNFLVIRARLLNDFKRLSSVYVVRNRDREEIKQLEEQFSD